jgi:hypothetical protein
MRRALALRRKSGDGSIQPATPMKSIAWRGPSAPPSGRAVSPLFFFPIQYLLQKININLKINCRFNIIPDVFQNCIFVIFAQGG